MEQFPKEGIGSTVDAPDQQVPFKADALQFFCSFLPEEEHQHFRALLIQSPDVNAETKVFEILEEFSFEFKTQRLLDLASVLEGKTYFS